ncbi:hypothetical protein D9M68_998440 [compost metagenome]
MCRNLDEDSPHLIPGNRRATQSVAPFLNAGGENPGMYVSDDLQTRLTLEYGLQTDQGHNGQACSEPSEQAETHRQQSAN